MNADVVDQLRALGAPDEVVERAEASSSTPAEVDFLVFEDNWQTVGVFCALSTQWKLLAGAADILYVGLDYGAIDTVARLEGVPEASWPVLFRELQVMERAALPLLNERT